MKGIAGIARAESGPRHYFFIIISSKDPKRRSGCARIFQAAGGVQVVGDFVEDSISYFKYIYGILSRLLKKKLFFWWVSVSTAPLSITERFYNSKRDVTLVVGDNGGWGVPPAGPPDGNIYIYIYIYMSVIPRRNTMNTSRHVRLPIG